jgi:hypothetical protein
MLRSIAMQPFSNVTLEKMSSISAVLVPLVAWAQD